MALTVETGLYYSLNPVGSRIWRLLKKPTRVAEICAQLATEYDIGHEACEREVCALLEELRGEGMIGIAENPDPD